MSVSGICEICQAGNVVGTCDRCGQLVCENHYDRGYGYCSECVVAVTGGNPPSGGTNYPDGVGEYRF